MLHRRIHICLKHEVVDVELVLSHRVEERVFRDLPGAGDGEMALGCTYFASRKKGSCSDTRVRFEPEAEKAHNMYVTYLLYISIDSQWQ